VKHAAWLSTATLVLACSGGKPAGQAAPLPAASRVTAPRCACGDKPCPTSYAEAVRVLSAACSESGYALTKTVGCGQIEVAAVTAFEGSQYFYRDSDGSLVGASFWFDVPISACPAYPSAASAQSCARAKPCVVCGQYEGLSHCSDALQ
jgi:hypothetical protein